MDSARLDGAYAGNRLKRYWLRPAQRVVEEVDGSHEPDSPNEPDRPDELDEVNRPGDGGSRKWPLLGRGFFVRVP